KAHGIRSPCVQGEGSASNRSSRPLRTSVRRIRSVPTVCDRPESRGSGRRVAARERYLSQRGFLLWHYLRQNGDRGGSLHSAVCHVEGVRLAGALAGTAEREQDVQTRTDLLR